MTDKRQHFLDYLKLVKSLGERERVLYASGLDIGNFVDEYYAAAKRLLLIAFSPSQVECIEWWLYENVEKECSFSDGSPSIRLDTPEQLWDFLHSHCEAA